MLRIITRSDDAGSSRSANAAILKAAQGAFVKNISLMAPGNYIDEAARLLKGQKHICFGMHFTMNAEWDKVKWGPVCQKLKGTAMTDAMSGWIKEKGLVDHRYFYNVLPQIDEISSTDGLFGKVLEKMADGQYFYLTHPAMPLEDMYLTGNKSKPTERIVEGRKKDMDFVVSPTTVQICEKYNAVPIRYDEAVYSEGDRDSIKCWFG